MATPSRRSVPGVLPDWECSLPMSTRSSASWNATPIRSPKVARVSTVSSGAPDIIAPNLPAVAIREPVLSARTLTWWPIGSSPWAGPTVSRIWPVQSRSNVRAWMRTASGPRSASRSDARANRKSPVRIATVLSQRALAESAPRRREASSITSSWYRVARCVSSTTTADEVTSADEGSPNCAASSVSSGRNRFPPASTRCRAALVTKGYSLTTDSRSSTSTCPRPTAMRASSPGSGSTNPSGRLEVRDGTATSLSHTGPMRRIGPRPADPPERPHVVGSPSAGSPQIVGSSARAGAKRSSGVSSSTMRPLR